MPLIPDYSTDTLDDTDALLGVTSGGTAKRYLGTQFVKPTELGTVAGFDDCIANLANIGFTFGGLFDGHGVYATGPVRFIVRDFVIS